MLKTDIARKEGKKVISKKQTKVKEQRNGTYINCSFNVIAKYIEQLL